MGQFFLPVISTAIAAYLLVPAIRQLALRFNIVDNPQARKLHKQAIPLMGGLSIYLAFMLGLLFFYQGMNDLNLKGVVAGGTLMLLVGYWDDRTGGIPWKLKLSFQILFAFIVVHFFSLIVSGGHEFLLTINRPGFFCFTRPRKGEGGIKRKNPALNQESGGIHGNYHSQTTFRQNPWNFVHRS